MNAPLAAPTLPDKPPVFITSTMMAARCGVPFDEFALAVTAAGLDVDGVVHLPGGSCVTIWREDRLHDLCLKCWNRAPAKPFDTL